MEKHCGTFIKCNNAEGCFGCEFEGEEENICVYCGENKWINPWKHIAKIVTFLQKKIIECQKILKDMQDISKNGGLQP